MRVLSTGLILSPSEAESFPEDDIDRLFEKLHKLEPPGDIVKQILARVKRLPVPRPLPPQDSEQFPAEKNQQAVE
jgi:hypothetical protein